MEILQGIYILLLPFAVAIIIVLLFSLIPSIIFRLKYGKFNRNVIKQFRNDKTRTNTIFIDMVLNGTTVPNDNFKTIINDCNEEQLIRLYNFFNARYYLVWNSYYENEYCISKKSIISKALKDKQLL